MKLVDQYLYYCFINIYIERYAPSLSLLNLSISVYHTWLSSAEAPTIIRPPKPVEVTAEGNAVNLTCGTTGKPDPTITWYKDDLQITGGRYIIAKTGDLQIRV